jgi:hypothetical protein
MRRLSGEIEDRRHGDPEVDQTKNEERGQPNLDGSQAHHQPIACIPADP